MNIRDHAHTLVGQPVVAHHTNGTVYHGILHSVTRRGIYIRPHTYMTAANRCAEDVVLADGTAELEGQLIFGGLFFLPWFALGALYGSMFW